MARILLLSLIIFFVQTIYASSATTAYRCKTNNRKIGYFDIPCQHIDDFFSKSFNKNQIIHQDIISLIDSNKKILTFNLPNKATITKSPTKLPKKENKKNKKLKSTPKLNKRCDRAITKISAIQQLLENKQFDQLTIKLQKDLAKYTLMEKKYCKPIIN